MRKLGNPLMHTFFSEEECEDLENFFQNIWQTKKAYKVFMARRGFNLNFAFMDIMDAWYNEDYYLDGIISNTALLLCAEEIAEYYKETGSFPTILIVDDILIHGRGIMKLIDHFEDLVTEYLREEKIAELLRDDFHNKLYSSLNIYVYAQNVGDILVDRSLKLTAFKKLKSLELRMLSQQISRMLQQYKIANTSYVLSVPLSTNFCKTEYGDNSRVIDEFAFPYRGVNLRYFYRNTENCILETLRTSGGGDDFYNQIVTSLVIFGDIPYSKENAGSFDQLCKSFAKQIERIIPYSRVVEILNYEQELLVRPRAQMLSYLLSIVSYADFYREKVSSEVNMIYKSLLQSDYKKISVNFDRLKVIQYDVLKFFDYVSREKELKDILFQIVEKYSAKLQIETEEEAASCSKKKWKLASNTNSYMSVSSVFERAEDIFYEIGMNAEKSANKYIKNHTGFDSRKPGNDFIQLRQYMQLMNRSGVQEFSSLGCALNLMDSGVFSMTLDLDYAQQKVQCILKAGELSTFILPRRFAALIPALSIVEKEYFKKGRDKKEVISQFIDYLQENCHIEEEDENLENLILLRKLRRSKTSLLYVYMAGQNLQDWNIDLLTEEDRFSHGMDDRGRFNAEKYWNWSKNEARRKRYYNYYAKMFLRVDE